MFVVTRVHINGIITLVYNDIYNKSNVKNNDITITNDDDCNNVIVIIIMIITKV